MRCTWSSWLIIFLHYSPCSVAGSRPDVVHVGGGIANSLVKRGNKLNAGARTPRLAHPSSEIDEDGIFGAMASSVKSAMPVALHNVTSGITNAIREKAQDVFVGPRKLPQPVLQCLNETMRFQVDQRQASTTSIFASLKGGLKGAGMGFMTKAAGGLATGSMGAAGGGAVAGTGGAVHGGVAGASAGYNAMGGIAGRVAASEKICSMEPNVEFMMVNPPPVKAPALLKPSPLTDAVFGSHGTGSKDGLKGLKYGLPTTTKKKLQMKKYEKIKAALIAYNKEEMYEKAKKHEIFAVWLEAPWKKKIPKPEVALIVQRKQDACAIMPGINPFDPKEWIVEEPTIKEKKKCKIEKGMQTSAPLCKGVTEKMTTSRSKIYRIQKKAVGALISGAQYWEVYGVDRGTGEESLIAYGKVTRFLTIQFWTSQYSMDDVIAEWRYGNANKMTSFNLDIKIDEDAAMYLIVGILTDLDRRRTQPLKDNAAQRMDATKDLGITDQRAAIGGGKR
eukprot:TRINITY_DN46584_c0_g1_i1.p1 TRINITY_DN46584_c0_g1~~TRINITY_DN46584_c0_g1_i1.p1  ORF type:complete len:504 (-),score=75.26 TRINITY_DN46584_c0_g1_i1:113-1624(-)